MARPQPSSRSLCRASVGVVAAYALALQALLVAMSGALEAGGLPLFDHAAVCAADAPSSSVPDRGPTHGSGACCVLAWPLWGPVALAGAPAADRRPWREQAAVPWPFEPILDLASLIRPLGPRAPPSA